MIITLIPFGGIVSFELYKAKKAPVCKIPAKFVYTWHSVWHDMCMCHSPRKWPHRSTKKVRMIYAANIWAVSSFLIPSEATFAMFITMLVFYFFWKSSREAASWVFIVMVGIHKPAFYLLLENQEWEGQAIGRNCILYYDESQQCHKMIVGGRQNRRILN